MAGKNGAVQTGCPAGTVDAAIIGREFGVSRALIAAWTKQGKMPAAAMRVGRKLLWHESVIEQMRAQFVDAVKHHHNMKEDAA